MSRRHLIVSGAAGATNSLSAVQLPRRGIAGVARSSAISTLGAMQRVYRVQYARLPGRAGNPFRFFEPSLDAIGRVGVSFPSANHIHAVGVNRNYAAGPPPRAQNI